MAAGNASADVEEALLNGAGEHGQAVVCAASIQLSQQILAQILEFHALHVPTTIQRGGSDTCARMMP